ncbi:MAG: RNB domain-containing ribonuclease [Propionibacteriaceae bacterium]|nr:RNB domain-containing ribonuclease [Propionibacteriaceae bacterium]
MPAVQLSARGVPEPIRAGLDDLHARLEVPDGFPLDVAAEARAAASRGDLPERDLTDVAFVTIDPPGSTDLDQALYIERDGEGYRVHYAIADVARFVMPGGAIDREVHERGLTLYAPNARTPLHPPELSEGAASLLPGQLRPALVWEHRLDARGEALSSTVAPARVRSREQLTYAGVQEALDGGTASEVLQLLAEVGRLRELLEAERGGVSLQIPEQEVHVVGDHWELDFRATLPVEGWNAQISLLTGMAAAQIMLEGGIGILRTLPPARQYGIDKLRRVAKGLKIRWPGAVGYPEFVRSLDPAQPTHLAMLYACTTLFRGAGYVAFDDGETPEQPLHGAMNAAYAHATAPLRRLVDRYVGEICVALCAGEPVPDWVRAELEGLPKTMQRATQRSNAYERGLLDLVEALVLAPHVGESFEGVITEWDAEDDRGEIQLTDPAVAARVTGSAADLGAEVVAELVEADVETGKVSFRVR